MVDAHADDEALLLLLLLLELAVGDMVQASGEGR